LEDADGDRIEKRFDGMALFGNGVCAPLAACVAGSPITGPPEKSPATRCGIGTVLRRVSFSRMFVPSKLLRIPVKWSTGTATISGGV
jgi:hypothetical protein